MSLLMVAVVLGNPGATGASEAIGETTLVVNQVRGTMNEISRPLAVGDPVFWKEWIETGDESATRLGFVDRTTLSTGANARVLLDEFVYSAGGSADRMAVNIGKGVMRFVSGTLEPGSYELRTPSAIIGLRGTALTVSVDDAGATTVYTQHGLVDVDNGIGSVLVGPGQMTRVPAPGIAAPPSAATPADGAARAQTTELASTIGVFGRPSLAVLPGDLAALRDQRTAAWSVTRNTYAQEAGPACGGC